MGRLLGNKRVIVRFVSLYCIGLLLFYISWTIGYFLFPEGFLSIFGVFGKLAGETMAGSLGLDFIIIFCLNLLGFLFILFGNYILRVKFFGFGYLVPLAWMAIYGLTLGTNSFSIALAERMPPSLAVFGRSGLYEMMAGVLLAAATNTISVNKSESFRSKSVPIPKAERLPLKKEQWVAICIAVVLLAGAALREAHMIINH